MSFDSPEKAKALRLKHDHLVRASTSLGEAITSIRAADEAGGEDSDKAIEIIERIKDEIDQEIVYYRGG